MVHGRLFVETRNRRQHAKGISGQEDDHVGVASLAHSGRIVDEVDGVCHACVLGQTVVKVVRIACRTVNDDVLADGAKADGVEDLRLGGRADLDGLGIATALKVEDAAISPSVLVVADQDALGICRKRGLSGTREAKEYGGLAR